MPSTAVAAAQCEATSSGARARLDLLLFEMKRTAKLTFNIENATIFFGQKMRLARRITVRVICAGAFRTAVVARGTAWTFTAARRSESFMDMFVALAGNLNQGDTLVRTKT